MPRPPAPPSMPPLRVAWPPPPLPTPPPSGWRKGAQSFASPDTTRRAQNVDVAESKHHEGFEIVP
ncbi:hypothetical protein U9M48_017426, partial [Paspalum notatum var. saurae]